MDILNVELDSDSVKIVDAFVGHYRATGNQKTGDNYVPKLKQFLRFLQAKEYPVTNPPPGAFEEFLFARWPEAESADTRNTNRQFYSSILKVTELATGFPYRSMTIAPREQSTKSPEQKKAERAEREAKKNRQVPQGLPAGASMPPSVPIVPSNDIPFGEGANVAGYDEQGQPQLQTQPQVSQPAPAAAQPQTVRIEVNQTPPKKEPAKPAVPAAPRGVTYDGVTFIGPYFKVSYLADGVNGPSGQYVQSMQASTTQINQTGDLAMFLQQTVLPSIPVSPNSPVIQFKVEEMNDRRLATGRFFDVPVSTGQGQPMQRMPMAGMPYQQGPQMPMSGLGGWGNMPMQQPQPSPFVDAYARQLEDQMRVSREREAQLQKQASEAQNQMQMMMLMQSMQGEQTRQRELEDMRRKHELESNRPATPVPQFMPPPPPPPAPVPEDPSKSIEAVISPFAEMTKSLIDRREKDPMETIMPLLQMNMQQSQAQLQAQQAQAQLQVQMMQQSSADMHKMMMAMTAQQQAQAQQSASDMQKLLMQMMADKERRAGEETPTERILRDQLAQMRQEVQALRQSGETDEDFMDKLLKYKQFEKMMGGGGGDRGFFADIAENFDKIGEGIGKALGGFTPAARQPQQRRAGPQAPPPALPATPQVVENKPVAPAAPVAAVPAPAAVAVPAADAAPAPAAEVNVSPKPAEPAAPATVEAPAVVPQLSQQLIDAVTAMRDAAEDDDKAVLDALSAGIIFVVTQGNEADKEALGQVLANFRDASDYEELFITVKNLFRRVGVPCPRTRMQEVTEVMHANYTQIYAQLSEGKEKVLEDAQQPGDESAEETEESEEAAA